MPTGLTKKFFNASDDSYTTLFSPCTATATELRCANLQPWNIGDKLVLTIDRIDANGDPTGKKERIYAEVGEDNYLINCIRGLDGDVAQPHGNGAIIEDVMTSTHIEALREGLLVEHDEQGLHNAAFLNKFAVEFGKKLYPVGSLYFNAGVATNPATLLGFGIWAAWGAGRVPVGVNAGDAEFDTLEETGGAKTHTLTSAEMPSHTHGQKVAANVGSQAIRRDYVSDGSAAEYDQGMQTYATGGGAAHNNLQPYITTYIWKRTA